LYLNQSVHSKYRGKSRILSPPGFVGSRGRKNNQVMNESKFKQKQLDQLAVETKFVPLLIWLKLREYQNEMKIFETFKNVYSENIA